MTNASRSIHPPGDAELYEGKLRLSRFQRFSTTVYACAGIVGGALLFGAGIKILIGDGLVQSIPALFFCCGFGGLSLWIGVGILRKSVLRHS